MLTSSSHSSKIQRILLRSLLVGALATTGILCGLIPDLTRPNRPNFNHAAYAQNFAAWEKRAFARALIAIEPHRLDASDRIESQTGSEPNIFCHLPQTFSGLPGNARNIARTYCSRSRAIVERVGLSVERFNQMTERARRDRNFNLEIQNLMRTFQ